MITDQHIDQVKLELQASIEREYYRCLERLRMKDKIREDMRLMRDYGTIPIRSEPNDDLATAMSFGILTSAGLKSKIVHINYKDKPHVEKGEKPKTFGIQ